MNRLDICRGSSFYVGWMRGVLVYDNSLSPSKTRLRLCHVQLGPSEYFYNTYQGAGAKQPVHWFLGGKGLGIQQGTSVWVGSPKRYQGGRRTDGNIENRSSWF